MVHCNIVYRSQWQKAETVHSAENKTLCTAMYWGTGLLISKDGS